MPRRDVILTALRHVRFESVLPFLRSLKRTGYDGEIIVFVSGVEKEMLDGLREHGATAVPFPFFGRHIRQRLAAPWPLWRRFFASGFSRDAKERVGNVVFHLFYRRHLLYLQFLRERRLDYDRVFLTDSRDVFFQADPFSWNPEKGVHFFLEEAANRIGQCPHHIRWIRSQFGQSVLEELGTEVASCAGTTFGDPDSVIEYLTAMVSLSMKAFSLREFDGDQGIHNYILRKKLLARAVIHENRSGPVMTLGPMRMDDIHLNRGQRVLNDRDEIVPVLHQYDRIPELKRLLLGRTGM